MGLFAGLARKFLIEFLQNFGKGYATAQATMDFGTWKYPGAKCEWRKF